MWRSVGDMADLRWSSLGNHVDLMSYNARDNIVDNWNELVNKIDEQYYQNAGKIDKATGQTIIRLPIVRAPEVNLYHGNIWITQPKILSSPPETLEELKNEYG
jgi:hypothetical protein